MSKQYVKIVNRDTYTNRRRAQMFIDRNIACAVMACPDTAEILEIRMFEDWERIKRKPKPPAGRCVVRGSLDSLYSNVARTSGNLSHATRFPSKVPSNSETTAYFRWRESVLKRDGYKCVQCGAKDRLEIDHLKPRHLYPSLKFDPSNGQTLCHDCHVKTSTYGSKVHRIIDVSVS